MLYSGLVVIIVRVFINLFPVPDVPILLLLLLLLDRLHHSIQNLAMSFISSFAKLTLI